MRGNLLTLPLHDYAVHGFGRMARLGKSSGQLIGFCGLKYLYDLQQVDIGYRLLPDCRGKGYATESSRAVIAEVVRRHGLSRLIGLVLPANLASARVLGKFGLGLERKVRLHDFAEELDLHYIVVSAARSS